MGLFGGFGYGAHRVISQAAQADAAQARTDARDASRSAGEQAARLDRATLACEAMWTILRDKFGLTDDDLLKRINELDLSDGKLDGKVRKTPVSCPKCHRTMSARLPRCMYCGQAVMHDPFA